jgi:hypothetical protein
LHQLLRLSCALAGVLCTTPPLGAQEASSTAGVDESQDAVDACMTADAQGPVTPTLLDACRKATANGSPDAQRRLARFLRRAESKFSRTADDLELKAAEGGHPVAQYQMAVRMIGTRDAKKGLEFLKEASCQGFPPAVKALGDLRGQVVQVPDCRPVQKLTFEGRWEGQMNIQPDGEKPDPLKTFYLRVDILGNIARVFTRTDGPWAEVAPGKFEFRRLKANAVLFYMDDGWDEDGNWVETWNLNLTIAADTRLKVTYQRQVNNIQTDRRSRYAAWNRTAYGDLFRVSKGLPPLEHAPPIKALNATGAGAPAR